MKTIKIFLASSEELDYDRMVFGNLVRRLDDMYEKRGIRIKLFEWEDYDAAFNGVRKQDEYNDYVRNSDMFLALFHTKAGKFTIEEFDIATEEFKKHASPKVYTYCKDLQPGEEESPELAEFKKRLFDEMGHYWCRYDNNDSMQLHFVMQLQLVENSQSDALKVENGEITLDGHHIASMDKLKFAAANEDYQKMQTEMLELHEEIERMQLDLEKKQQKLEKKKAKLEKDPDDEEYQEEYQEVKEEEEELVDRLQPKLDKYNKMKEEYADYQKLLFDTAKRVAQLQGERITERMRRAMEAFNDGKIREANIILDEAEADAKRNLEDYKQSKEITELKRQAVINSIEELQLKASTVMADASIPIKERIAQTEQIYAQADEMAKEVDYAKDKYIELLFSYGSFLLRYGRYNNAIIVREKAIDICDSFYGTTHPTTARSYLNISVLLREIEDYERASYFCQKALKVQKVLFSDDNIELVLSYNNMGCILMEQGDYDRAIGYLKKALEISKHECGKEQPNVAEFNNNIGYIYLMQGKYEQALECNKSALLIRINAFGEEHVEVAMSYSNMGVILNYLGDYSQALECFEKGLAIRIKLLGEEHPDTSQTYLGIGELYHAQGVYKRAMFYYQKYLNNTKKVFGDNHPKTARAYLKIGNLYKSQGDFEHTLDYYKKGLGIQERFYDKGHPDMVKYYNNVALMLSNRGYYTQALEYLKKAYEICEVFLENKHPDTITTCWGIAWSLHMLDNNEEALHWAEKASKASPHDPGIKDTLAIILQDLGRNQDALEQLELCLTLKHNQNASETSVRDTEGKIASIKMLLASNSMH